MTEQKQVIPEGYKQTEVGVIPEDWSVVEIRELITDLRGGAPLKPTDFIKTGVKVLPKGGVIRGGKLRVKESEQQYCSVQFSEKFHKNTITEKYTVVVLRDLVPSGPSIGLMVEIAEPKKYVLAQGVYGFLVEHQYTSKYLIQYSNTSDYRRIANEIMVGSTQVHITNGAFKSIKIPLPPYEQQKKIATALSDVDALISELEKLIAKKQAIKTATMQQLLTGKTRLPQFALREDGTPKGYKASELGEMPEDWVVSRLEQLVSFQNGVAHENCIDESGSYIVVNSKFISTDGVVSKSSKECRQPASKNTILMVMSDVPNGRAIAKCFLVETDDKYTVNQRICILQPEAAHPEFLVYKLNRNPFYLSFDDGVKQTNLRRQDVLDCPLVLPTIIEQISISKVLHDMIDEIKTLQQRLNKTRQIKQGMMQELLTGKTRLI